MSAIGNQITTEEVLAELGARLRTARLERNVTVDAVAAKTGLNRKTLLDLELGRDVKLSTLIKMLRAMDMLGNLEAAFPDTLPGAEAFAAPGRLRQRATGSRKRSAG